MVRFAVVTDIHYADAPSYGTREYRNSLAKVRDMVGMLRHAELDFLVHLGDLIDTAPTNARPREDEYAQLMVAMLRDVGCPLHFLLGNKCLQAMTKQQMLQICGQKDSNYAFDVKDTHFVVLDGCFSKDGISYQPGRFDYHDTRLPDAQLAWLETDLKRTRKKAVVFCHQRLDEPRARGMAIANRPEVRGLLSRSGKVSAVFMGHTHENDLQRIEGVPYVALQALVEGAGIGNSAFSILEAEPSGALRMTGYYQHRGHPFCAAG